MVRALVPDVLSSEAALELFAQPGTAILLAALFLTALALLVVGVRDVQHELQSGSAVQQQERIISLKFNSFSGGLRSASPKPTRPGRPPLPCSPLSHVSRFQVKKALLAYGRQS